MTEDENILLKRQVEELRQQLNTKDLDLKNYHRTIADLKQQLTETENVCIYSREKPKKVSFLFYYLFK
jgi:chromosome segregation ATPase